MSKFHLVQLDECGQQSFSTDLVCNEIPNHYLGSSIIRYYESEKEFKKDRLRLENLREEIINLVDDIGDVLSSISPIGELYMRHINISPLDYIMIFNKGSYIYPIES